MTTKLTQEEKITKWLDEPIDLDKEFGGPFYRRRKRQRRVAREKFIRKVKKFLKFT